MSILITGGTGFVGYAMSENMHTQVELLNRKDYKEAWWLGHDWEKIVHLAPVLPDRVIECAKHCGARILYASSGAAYAERPSEYGKMKLQSEQMLKDSGVDYVVARMFTFMGPHMNWDYFAVGNFIRDAEAGGPINIMGDGLAIRSYLYSKDMADWMWKILFNGKSGETYDVGSGEPITIKRLAEMIAYQYLPVTQINILRKISREPAAFYMPRFLDKTRQELGLHQTVSLEIMLGLTTKAYKNEK